MVEIPLIPLGTYRYKTADESHAMKSRFWCRRAAWNWPQILKTWAVGLTVGGAAIGALVYYEMNKGKK
jgi:hypothetical protein